MHGYTVAEKDTAAAAKAAMGHPSKIDSLPYNWLTKLLSRTHAQEVSLSVCLFHRPHEPARTVVCNGDQVHQRNGLGLVLDRG